MAEPLSWTIHRAKENPTKTVVASVFILAFVAFSWVVFGPMLAGLAVVVMFLALNTYFLPITCTFTEKGIEVDKRFFTARYEWKQFRRWFRTSGGIVISPFSRKNYLDNFRGVHLLLPVGERQTPNAKRRKEGTVRRENAGERDTHDARRMTPEPVRTEDIIAYLEKRFAPPPPDERLRLDDEPS
ncbi:YcxB family protein [candidate division WOR-3 bacterium]|uniref:YcxB family protein n=1 Tax=candidate division WOR-3 bacterium TaxID=2052148 RepID=A0A937XHZ6_UNCW3|nr:YcxB family protein [candidate division WOR-3 bacterium]